MRHFVPHLTRFWGVSKMGHFWDPTRQNLPWKVRENPIALGRCGINYHAQERRDYGPPKWVEIDPKRVIFETPTCQNHERNKLKIAKKWISEWPKMGDFETPTCQNLPWKVRENPKKGVKIDPFWVTFGPPGFKNSSHLLGKTGKNVHFWVKKSPFLTIFWSFP